MARDPDDRGPETPPERMQATIRLRLDDISPASSVKIYLRTEDQEIEEDMALEGEEYVYRGEVSSGRLEYVFVIKGPGEATSYYPHSKNHVINITEEGMSEITMNGVHFTVEKLEDKDEDSGQGGPSRRKSIIEAIGGIAGTARGKVIDITEAIARKRRGRREGKERARAEREAQNRQEDILQDRFPVNFRIKPSKWVKFPPDPEVILHIFNAENPTGKKYPLHQEGGEFVSDVEIPVGPFQYQFEIKSSSSKIIQPIFYPHAPETEEVLGDGSIHASYLGAGITIVQGSRWEATETPFAQVGPDRTADTREQTVASLRETFGDLFNSVAPEIAQKPGHAPNRKALGAFHKGLEHAAERMADITVSRRPDVRALLGRDLLALVHETHNQWIQGRTDVSASVKNQLNTPNGRLLFRIKTFNELCNQKKLGLKTKHKIQARVDEDGFDAYAQEKLGRHWRVFDRICSSYDGGNMHRALRTAVLDTDSEAGNIDASEERGKERDKLLGRVIGRLRRDTKDIYTLDMKRWAKSAKALEETVDLAAKGSLPVLGTMVAFFGLNPWALSVPATLMAIRGISEFLGYDFGSVLWKGGTFPFRLPWKAGKKVFKFPPSASALPRASLSFGERFKLLFRGILPIPTVLTKIPWGGFGKKMEKIVPGSDLDPGETGMKEREHTAADVEAACKRMLGEGGGGPPTPGPAPHPPEHPTTPPAPVGGHPEPEHHP